MHDHNGNGKTFATVRLDLATKLAVLAALLYDGHDLSTAVSDAVKLNALCDAKARELKRTAA